MKDLLLSIYNKTTINNRANLVWKNDISISFILGANVRISGNTPASYKVEFIDQDTGIIDYVTTIGNNQWCKTNKEYCINWLINVYENNQLIASHSFSPTGKRVLIYFDSKALGDTVAWFAKVDQFQKKYNCNVIVSTYHNYLFEKEYPHIEFVEPGTEVPNLYAQYTVGFFHAGKKADYNRSPINCRTKSLQDSASAVLNLSSAEIRPKITLPQKSTDIKEKYVVIAPHASSHAKYWNNPGGWQIVIDYLNSIGYKVVMITQEKLGDPLHDNKLYGKLQNVIDKTGDISIQERLIDIKGAALFIGLGSGLSWLSWALGTKTILISGFSLPHTEFQDCIRVSPTNPFTCSGCFNREWLDPGDWEWCPEHKDSERAFECTKKILPETIIESINVIIRK
jgi:autotransporter strand-loop-strand O-heptosyltransferase